MTPDIRHIAVRRSDIDLGRPLPWAVYDSHGNLLLKQGFVLETKSQVDALIEKGLYRDRQGVSVNIGFRRDGRDAGEAGPSDPSGERIVPLDEIKLAIGDSFQIQAQAEQAESGYYVKLIGYLKGRSVIVTMPEVDGRLCFVREGQAFVVRFFAGRNAYAFTASVLRSSNIPFPHLHLSYPSQVRGLMVRTGERVPVRIICAVAIQDDTRTVTTAAMVTNISVSGAMLASKGRLGNKGDLLSIKFRVDIREIEFLASIDATIRYVSSDESGEFLHGVQFAGLPNDVAIALTAFVYQKLAESSR